MLLKLAVLSLVESRRNDPDKYSSLLYQMSASSTTNFNGQYFGSYMYEQKPYMSYDHDGEASVAMLVEEAEKLYSKLAKEQVDEIITDYASSISSSSLPLLPSSNEQQEKTGILPNKPLMITQKRENEDVRSIRRLTGLCYD